MQQPGGRRRRIRRRERSTVVSHVLCNPVSPIVRCPKVQMSRSAASDCGLRCSAQVTDTSSRAMDYPDRASPLPNPLDAGSINRAVTPAHAAAGPPLPLLAPLPPRPLLGKPPRPPWNCPLPPCPCPPRPPRAPPRGANGIPGLVRRSSTTRRSLPIW